MCALRLPSCAVQEKGQWTNVSACVSGDFALQGHNQILLLDDEDKGVSYNHWKTAPTFLYLSGSTFYMNEGSILCSIPPSDEEVYHTVVSYAQWLTS